MNLFAVGAAILLGLCSAYFSILGLAQIFHGSFWQVVIMGIALELGKFATALFVHRHWKSLGLAIKSYLAIATLVLMVLTSAGIFGFLAKSSQSVSAPIAAEQTRLAYITTQLGNIDVQRVRQEAQLKSLDGMVGIYTKEADLKDARVGVRLFSRQKQQRDSANTEIKKLNAEEQTLLLEKLNIEQKIQAVELEVGPAVYIAQALYGSKDIGSVESAIRVVVFLIIFAFDPLAIALLVGAQRVRELEEPTVNVVAEKVEVVQEVKPVDDVVKTAVEEVVTKEETPRSEYSEIINRMKNDGVIVDHTIPTNDFSDITRQMRQRRGL